MNKNRSINASEELWKEIEKLADSEGRSTNNYTVRILEGFVDGLKGKKNPIKITHFGDGDNIHAITDVDEKSGVITVQKVKTTSKKKGAIKNKVNNAAPKENKKVNLSEEFAKL